MSGLRRVQIMRPGYDCVANPCGVNGCGTNPGSGHGMHGLDYHYGVTDEERALVITVYSGIYPNGTRGEPMIADMSMCFMTAAEAAACKSESVRKQKRGKACVFLGCPCYMGPVWGLYAREVFANGGGRTDRWNQDEGFWMALESEFVKRVAP